MVLKKASKFLVLVDSSVVRTGKQNRSLDVFEWIIILFLTGRPNQAHYFIGYVGDEALYLDPHTTQKCGSIGEKITQNEIDLDCSYHQKYAARIQFEKMDPSLALSFLCRTREEFTELCTRLRDDICGGNQPPLFEIVTTGQVTSELI